MIHKSAQPFLHPNMLQDEKKRCLSAGEKRSVILVKDAEKMSEMCVVSILKNDRHFRQEIGYVD